MKLISHRGNTNGPRPDMENSPKYIIEAIKHGYDVEVDIWAYKQIWLGHDGPEYPCPLKFLFKYKDKLWIHCKNLDALNILLNFKELNIFWHQNDDYTLTSHGFIWTFPNKKTCSKSVLVINNANEYKGSKCFALCSDFL
jgi:hypothetical protein